MKIQRIAILGAALLLHGCGFSPMYGQLSAPEHVLAELDAIHINAADSDLGVRVNNELGDLLHGGGTPADPRYTLDISLTSTQVGGGYRIDASVTREQITLEANYRLVDNATGETLLESKHSEKTSIDVLESQFATIVSRDDALNRAARELSEEIQLDLSLFFKNRDLTRPAKLEPLPADPV